MTAADSTFSSPKVAFVTTVKNRVQHLRQTLPQNIADNPHALFIVVNCGTTDDLTDYVWQHHRADLDAGRLILYRVEHHGPFEMAKFKNVGHSLAIREGATHLANMDADNFAGLGFADYIADQFAEHRDIFLWSRMVQRCNAGDTCKLPRGHDGDHSDRHEDVDRLPEDQRPRVRGISGRIVVSAETFLKVGGYDEKFSDYGPDDKDMNRRLTLMGIEPREIPFRFLGAIHHGSRLRFRDYPHAEIVEYEDPPNKKSHTAVVNFGQIGVATAWRNFPLYIDPIHIDPIPTRVFGIGMQKTGTTSLAEALRILGLDCAHWPTPRWARNVWTQMREFGKSLTLERHYAATDLPISVMYRELDTIGYPNSKFILTIRDDFDWLRSVAAHWGDQNPWRHTWNDDCFTHRMHQEVYGCRNLNLDIMLARYRRHNAEVLAYFRNRPHDLLVMNLDDDIGWFPLCTFLGKPIPAIPYPRSNSLAT